MFDDSHHPDNQPPHHNPILGASPLDGLVVLDTDLFYDPDDFTTLVIAARTIPNLAVITADETRGRRARLARHVLDLMDCRDVPVIAGIDIGGEQRFVMDDHLTGLPLLPYDVTGAVDELVEAAARLCASTTGPIHWVGMGPMTNLTAIVSYAPDLAERVTVTQMGGWLDRYRDKARASHNFRIDPASAGLALRVTRNPRLVLSDVTNSPHIEVTPNWALLHRIRSSAAPWQQLIVANAGNPIPRQQHPSPRSLEVP
ncbi:nucleoside hydrolase [Nocardia sp. KC 131]|uniref:nucleoside hydrolase n=1 Tax=Nocardia arseniciresistens TaxID=3392119 RepID=UPI00398F5496